jgi:hypothetical protein
MEMNSKVTQRSIRELGPAPHTWEQAAEYLCMDEKALWHWFPDSGVPGADGLKEDGSWPLADRVQFLKVLCGEKE